MIAAEGDREAGVRAVAKRIQVLWDEITAQARREVLPSTIEEFVRRLEHGDISLQDSLSVLDCFDGCTRCGTQIFKGADYAAWAILNHYKKRVDRWNLADRIPDEFEEGDYGLCGYCSHMMSKD